MGDKLTLPTSLLARPRGSDSLLVLVEKQHPAKIGTRRSRRDEGRQSLRYLPPPQYRSTCHLEFQARAPSTTPAPRKEPRTHAAHAALGTLDWGAGAPAATHTAHLGFLHLHPHHQKMKRAFPDLPLRVHSRLYYYFGLGCNAKEKKCTTSCLRTLPHR